MLLCSVSIVVADDEGEKAFAPSFYGKDGTKQESDAR
jgi:hypothetical protein